MFNRPIPAGRGLSLLRVLWHAPKLVRMFARLMADRRVPVYAKLLPVLGVAYLVMPLDFDYVLPVGLIDDLAVLYACLRLFVFLCPRSVVQEHLLQVEGGRPRPPTGKWTA